MNLVQLKVTWVDNYAISRTIARPITDQLTEDWIDGWFAGVAEMLAHRGGRITEVIMEPIK